MQKTILVSNQRINDCYDILKAFDINEKESNNNHIKSIDNVWNQISNDYTNKYNKPIWKDNALILINLSLNNDDFIFDNYEIIEFEQFRLGKVPKVDYQHLNGYL